MSSIASQFFQFVVGSLWLRSAAAGLGLGAVAQALLMQPQAGFHQAMAALVVIGAGSASAVCFLLDRMPAATRAERVLAAYRVLGCVGSGVLVAMHLPGWIG